MPIFRVKSVKIYTGQKNLHEYIRGVREKYQAWMVIHINDNALLYSVSSFYPVLETTT